MEKELARLKEAGPLCPDCSPFLDLDFNSLRKLCVATSFVMSPKNEVFHSRALMEMACSPRPSS